MRGRLLLSCAALGATLGSAGCASTASPSTSADVCGSEVAPGSGVSRQDILSSPGRPLLDLIRERVPGVEVKHVKGRPFVTIRGRNSVYAPVEPLVVIDGVTLFERGVDGIERVEPTEVQSVKVVRDASELAMYGSEGGAGVVRIQSVRAGCE